MTASQYPECQKLRAGADERSTINDFLEWMQEKYGAFLARYDRDSEFPDLLWPLRKSADALAQEYLGVDPVKLENERRDILAKLREGNEVESG